MRKRVDKNDATQEVSSSMLVPDKKPPVYPNLPKNDASMWMQAPVSAEDFVGAAKKKPVARRSGRGVMVAVLAAMLVAAIGGGIWYAFLRESPIQTAASDPKPAPAPAPAPAVAPMVVDAAVAVAAPDAAAAAPVDAGAAAAGALTADAISGADPAMKKAVKKRPATTKKKVTKKKTAAAPKKRR